MTEIFIENFQSIKNVHFKIDGFTVIVGRNNVGKSAIIRAIDSALSNETGSDFIRKGEKETRVRILRDDIDIKWKKGDSASYEIISKNKNKETFSKLNRAVPKPLIDAGFEKIAVEDKMISPTIATQFEPLFLLNKRGSIITEVLTNLYDMDLISIADDKCQKDLKSQKSQYKIREIDLKNLQSNLEKYKDFDNIKITVKNIVTQEKINKALQEEIDLIKIYETNIDVLERSLKNLKVINNVHVPDPKICEKAFSDLQWLVIKEQDLDESTTNLKRLKEFKKIDIPEVNNIDVLINEVNKLKLWEDSIKASENEIKKLSIIEAINFTILTSLISSIEINTQSYLDIKKIEDSFISTATTAKTIRDEIKIVEGNLEQKTIELKQIKVCPLCNKTL